jgi:hypothetical protein
MGFFYSVVGPTPHKGTHMTSAPQDKTVLYVDLEGSSSLKLPPEQRSRVKKEFQRRLLDVVKEFSCDDIPPGAFRGDDALVYFNDSVKCVTAAVTFHARFCEFQHWLKQEFVENTKQIGVRIICFCDAIYGDAYSNYTGKMIEAILPYERDFGANGTVRLIGDPIIQRLDGTPFGFRFSTEGLVFRKIKGKDKEDYPLSQLCIPSHTNLSWNNLSTRIIQDLDDYLKAQAQQPDLVIFSGSKGGAVCGGISFASVICNDEVRVVHIDTHDLDFLFLNHELPSHKAALVENMINDARVVLLIESTRQYFSPYTFILKKYCEGRTLLDYVVVWVFSNDMKHVPEPSQYSFKTNNLSGGSFRFPWYLHQSDEDHVTKGKSAPPGSQPDATR